MSRSLAVLVLLLLLGLGAGSAHAGSFTLFQDDRTAFEAALVRDTLSTVVDSGGTFAADPAAASSLDVLVRTGTIGGLVFTYAAYDVDFSNSPVGRIVPGVIGDDIFDLDRFGVELPAAASGAVGAGTWGLDGGTGSSSTRNALLLDFTSTPLGRGIGHFGVDLLDFEASFAFTPGALRLYDGGVLVFEQLFGFGSGAGNGVTHFLGVVGSGDAPYFDQVAILIGDDSGSGGRTERWAADRFTFGLAAGEGPVVTVETPEPASWVALLAGAALLGLARRRTACQSDAVGDSRTSTNSATKS